MPTEKRDPILFARRDTETLRMFVEALNTESFHVPVPTKGGWSLRREDYRPVRRELRRLVQTWFESGPNVKKLLSNDRILGEAALGIPARILATQGAGARVTFTIARSNVSAREFALGLFFDFLFNPLNEKLGGPCKHCGIYYVKKTRRQLVYCSQRCGLRHTAISATRGRRAQEHLDRLEIAKRLTSQWIETSKSIAWKEWVHSRQPAISKNWLTRAVRKGELVEQN
jgi:hypothetical protein